MARPITSALSDAATSQGILPIFFGHFAFDSGDVRMWTGVTDVDWDGETWIGGGDLIGVQPAEETMTLAAAGAVFTLSGIPSELISIALAETYQERAATLWLGAMDFTVSPPTVIDPTEILAARMDVMTIDEGPDTSTVGIAVENRLVDGEVAKQRRYTPEDQKNEFAGDTLLDGVAALQDAEIVWGRG